MDFSYWSSCIQNIWIEYQIKINDGIIIKGHHYLEITNIIKRVKIKIEDYLTRQFLKNIGIE